MKRKIVSLSSSLFIIRCFFTIRNKSHVTVNRDFYFEELIFFLTKIKIRFLNAIILGKKKKLLSMEEEQTFE